MPGARKRGIEHQEEDMERYFEVDVYVELDVVVLVRSGDRDAAESVADFVRKQLQDSELEIEGDIEDIRIEGVDVAVVGIRRRDIG